MAHSSNTSPPRLVVAKHLRRPELWQPVESTVQFDRSVAEARLHDIANAVKTIGEVPRSVVDSALEKSLDTVRLRFSDYGGAPRRTFNRSYLIPYQSFGITKNITHHLHRSLPLLSTEMGVDQRIALLATTGFPPFILDTFTQSHKEANHGALIALPLFKATATGLNPTVTPAGIEIETLLREGIRYAANTLGSKFISVSSSLPDPRDIGLSPTDVPPGTRFSAGRAGIVQMLLALTKKLSKHEQLGRHNRIGVITGALRTGPAFAYSFLEDPELSRYGLNLFDNDPARGRALRAALSSPRRCSFSPSALELFNSVSIIVNIARARIDLDDLDPWCQLDLTGKIILEGGPPVRFHPEQVQQRGGRVVWAVGQDASEDRAFTRDNRFSYSQWGLVDTDKDRSALWGSEAEAGIIAINDIVTGRSDSATLDDVRTLSEFFRTSISLAPYQAAGKLVYLPK